MYPIIFLLLEIYTKSNRISEAKSWEENIIIPIY